MDFKGVVDKLKSYIGDEEEVPLEEEKPTDKAIEDLRFQRLSEKLNNPKPKNDYFAPEGENPEDSFLENIATIESSGGQDVKHPIIKYGIHKGSSAMGRYGLMPNTIRDVSGMLKNKQSMLKMHLGDNYSDPEVEALADMNDASLRKLLQKRPDLEQRVGRYMSTRLNLMEGDEYDKAYRWNRGHNIKKKDIDPSKRDEYDYIKKYKKAQQKLPILSTRDKEGDEET